MTEPYRVQRRVAGSHNIRLDGMQDLLSRAGGASVLDIGCNRGLVGYEFAANGARLVHGCDNFEPGIATARELFADLRSVDSRFEVVDLTGGPEAVSNAFGQLRYDIVLMLATLHKLKRVMPVQNLSVLLQHFGKRTGRFFAWRGTSEKPDENEAEADMLDVLLKQSGLRRVHTSYLSEQLGLCAIWKRI